MKLSAYTVDDITAELERLHAQRPTLVELEAAVVPPVVDLRTYLSIQARTVDEHDIGAGPKPLPDWPYLAALTDEYEQNPLLLVEKCRQVLVTWWACAVVSWELRRPGRWGWISLKEETADAAVERVWSIVRNLGGTGTRREWTDPQGLKWERTYTKLRCSSGASLSAMSQSADEARSHTFTGVFVDEAAFLPNFRETMSAMLPTIDGGGRAVLITTPGPLGLCANIFAGKDA